MTTTILPASSRPFGTPGVPVGRRRQLIRAGMATATILLGGFIAATAFSHTGPVQPPPASVEIYSDMVRSADSPAAVVTSPAPAPVSTSAPSSLDVLSAMNAAANG